MNYWLFAPSQSDIEILSTDASVDTDLVKKTIL